MGTLLTVSFDILREEPAAVDRNGSEVSVRGEPMWIYFSSVYTNTHKSEH